MFFSWLRRRRRNKIVSRPFPDDWNRVIHSNVKHDAHLPAEHSSRLRDVVQVFVAEKNWEGCNGLEMTDEVKVTISAQAALLILGDSNTFFDHVLSILVYPDEYVQRDTDINPSGIVTERDATMLGQAHLRGPVVLSWADVLAGGRREDGENLVLHEFAHQLDMMNGRHVDGIPPLNSRPEIERWMDVMGPAYRQLVENCRRRRYGVINCYGAQNEAEFLAVLVEAFFENSELLKQQHPSCYQLLADYFQVDPALWTDRN